MALTMQRTRNVLVAIVFALLWLPLLAIVGLILILMGIPVAIQGYLLHRRWKRKLASSRRLANISVLASATTSGTLIVDRPAIGWNTTYLWWTPNNVSAETEVPIPTDDGRKQFIVESGKLEHPFDRWCYDRFLSTETGTGLLISTRRGEQLAERLKNDAPDAKVIYTWSAPCLDGDLNARKA